MVYGHYLIFETIVKNTDGFALLCMGIVVI